MNMVSERGDRIAHHPNALPPFVAALHAARSALTVAGGRVALARQRAACGADLEWVLRDLDLVPEHLALVARAMNDLAELAQACAPSPPHREGAIAADA